MEAIEGLENMSVVESRIEDLTSERCFVRGDVMEAVGQRGDAKAADPLIRALKAVAGYVRDVTVGDRRNVLRMIILGMLGVFYGFLVVLMLL